jgi:hypothetical protein
MKTFVTARALMAILRGKKGPGWYHLPARWYLKPRELYHVARIAVNVFVNMAVAVLPLRVTEPIMTRLNPAIASRPRVTGYDGTAFQASQWDKEAARQKTAVLKAAQEERRTTGRVTIELPVAPEPSRPAVPAGH